MKDGWSFKRTSYLASGGEIVTEECNGVVRMALVSTVMECAPDNAHEARRRLAGRLQTIAAELPMECAL